MVSCALKNLATLSIITFITPANPSSGINDVAFVNAPSGANDIASIDVPPQNQSHQMSFEKMAQNVAQPSVCQI
jgi:hypothetical protein